MKKKYWNRTVSFLLEHNDASQLRNVFQKERPLLNTKYSGHSKRTAWRRHVKLKRIRFFVCLLLHGWCKCRIISFISSHVNRIVKINVHVRFESEFNRSKKWFGKEKKKFIDNWWPLIDAQNTLNQVLDWWFPLKPEQQNNPHRRLYWATSQKKLFFALFFFCAENFSHRFFF